MVEKITKKQQWGLWGAIFFALALHVLALYALMDLPLADYSSERSYWRNLVQSNEESQEQIDKERQDYLTEVFRLRTPSEENVPDLEGAQDDFVPMSWKGNEGDAQEVIAEVAPPPPPLLSDDLAFIKTVLEETENRDDITRANPVVAVPQKSSIEQFIRHPSLDVLRPKRQEASFSSFSNEGIAQVASSHAFDLKVDYAFQKDEQGIIFRITFLPKPEYVFKRIAQNYFFLIDRSNSIDAQRFEQFKKAVFKSLALLKKEDTFNILIFDQNIVALSPHNIPWNADSIDKAFAFLEQQQHGGMLATTDLYSSLGNIVPDAVADNEVNTAILLSDGDTFLSKQSQRQTIAKWTKRNAGKVSLYSVAAGRGNNIALLDLLSAFNKGHLTYTPQLNNVEQALFQLMKSLRNPIGKEMVATAVTASFKPSLELYPSSNRMPDLYEQTPYVLYGTMPEWQDFTLFLQGKYYDHWLDIKQSVTLSKAKLVPRKELEKAWAIQKAYALYDRYFQEGNSNSLLQAKQLVAPWRVPTAF